MQPCWIPAALSSMFPSGCCFPWTATCMHQCTHHLYKQRGLRSNTKVNVRKWDGKDLSPVNFTCNTTYSRFLFFRCSGMLMPSLILLALVQGQGLEGPLSWYGYLKKLFPNRLRCADQKAIWCRLMSTSSTCHHSIMAMATTMQTLTNNCMSVCWCNQY